VTPSPSRVNRVKKDKQGRPLDLYEAGDQLAPDFYSAERAGQTLTHSVRILPDDYVKVVRSGWTKPSIQLGALLFLRDRGDLILHGRRRLHRLLTNISSSEIQAALRHAEKISKFPEKFGTLLRWSQRPFHLKKYHRAEKRRIGVGYRDKGSMPPSHSRGRKIGEQGLLYLGEEKEFLNVQISPMVQSHLARCLNGVLLFHHVSDGWWRILTPYERFLIASHMLEKTLAKY